MRERSAAFLNDGSFIQTRFNRPIALWGSPQRRGRVNGKTPRSVWMDVIFQTVWKKSVWLKWYYTLKKNHAASSDKKICNSFRGRKKLHLVPAIKVQRWCRYIQIPKHHPLRHAGGNVGWSHSWTIFQELSGESPWFVFYKTWPILPKVTYTEHHVLHNILYGGI